MRHRCASSRKKKSRPNFFFLGYLTARAINRVWQKTMPCIEAGRPTGVWLHAETPIPPDTALTLLLRGPKTLKGVVAERTAPTVNIEARFAVKVAGDYTLIVRQD